METTPLGGGDREGGDEDRSERQRLGDKRRRGTQESSAHREQRLARQREYNRRRRTASDNQGGRRQEEIGTELETEAHRQDRLARQREYNRVRRLSSRDSGSTSTPQETNEERDQRLHHQREYDRQRSQARRTAESTRESAPLEPASAEVIAEIERRLEDALGANGLDECVCAVCDRLELRKRCQLVEPNDSTCFKNMKRVLQVPVSLPEALAEQYSCENLHASFAGLLLSRRGVMLKSCGVKLSICGECHAALIVDTGSPPKYAIANGFFVGSLPENLAGATWMEKVMTQLVTVVAQTRIMRGGRHRAIRSHCMVFDSTPGPPATLLPRRIDRESPYKVVLAGPFTTAQSDRIRKLHQVRGAMVTSLLAFFKQNNPFYAEVETDAAFIQVLEANVSVCEDIFVTHAEEDEEDASASMDQEQDSISSWSYPTVGEESEASVVERNILLTAEEMAPDASFFRRVVDLNAHEPALTPRLQLSHSSRFAAFANIEAKMHPHLFPFGRGHPDEARRTYVSRHDCMRYYAMLSSRRFAQDPTFMLTAFNRLSLQNMYTLTSVKCRRYSSLFDGYETISRDDLAVALINNERRQRGEQRREPASATAERFLKSVELGSVSVWGSSAERRQCRQEAFGYQTRFGQPALFVTLTPNTDNSYAMAHYTGVLSVETLFDVLEARIPNATEMQQAAMSDDSASARLFMRNVDAFIEHVLGFDLKTMQSRELGGLFGRTKAYYGMVETQGRGTLHIHFLIWLYGAPVNSAAYEASVLREGEPFKQMLEQYLDSIVTTQFPLKTQLATCSGCGTEGDFVPVGVPASARRQRPRRDPQSGCEPAIVQCGACGTLSSSQHIIRNLLIRNRPHHWPPPLRLLTDEERQAQINREVGTRSSMSEATTVIREREMNLAAMIGDDSDQTADWLLRINNPLQQSEMSAEDDPFRSDTMSRLIEMLPPTLDAPRMEIKDRDFMLASLVMRLNMHAWSHTGSCFKASRATSSAKTCRYGFPRQRALSSSVGGASIVQKRDLCHEYINGYNPTIMRTFKCNHDVQLLFGGKSAINRIYYTCKYVTKAQRQIDNTTAVALASFHRRESREAEDATSNTPSSVSDIRRRRVTGMIHTFTNKQEIAGPLAALYLLRGSCNYASANCVRLSLADVLKQIEGSDDYGCTLVPSGANEDEVYASTSNLDDYIYRPESLSGWSLYEFKMRCYRRIAGGSISDQHRFNDRHPLSRTHCIAYRTREAVPVISGPRLPQLKEEMQDDQKELFAKVALTLFKPFRKLADLLAARDVQDHPWFAAYRAWEPHRSEFVKLIMGNMNDYHVGRASENDEASINAEDGASSAASDGDSSDDGYISDDVALSDSEAEEDNLQAFFDSPGAAVLDSFPTPLTFSAPVERVLAEFERHLLVRNIAQTVAESHCKEVIAGPVDLLSKDWLKKWVADDASDTASSLDSSHLDAAGPMAALDYPTRINEIIDECLQPDQQQWCRPSRSDNRPGSVPLYAGVSTVSAAFTLNKRQHAAFAIAAKHLLPRWRVVEEQSTISIPDEEVERRQLLMFLGGEGGTGKSRVVGSIQELCRCWQRPASVVVTAMTGKAASLIGGRTLASFEMVLKGPSRHTALRDVDCLIIDEVSMMSKIQLLRLDRLLRKAKRVDTVPFGGLHVIMVGDFLQLPPVGADPLFINPTTKAKVSLEDFEGFELWRRFKTVIVLRETVRFREDPEWGEGCSKARYGEWTPAFLKMINDRVVGYASEQAMLPPLPLGTVFVTPNNDTRSGINSHFIATTSRLLPAEEYPVRIVANFKGALNKLSNEDVSYIMGLPDTVFGRMAPYIDMVRGMPIQITQNVRTKKGVANGTMGELHSVKFPAGTSYQRIFDRRTSTMVLLPDKRPLYALVRLARGSDVVSITEGVDPDLFPVFPDAEAYKKVTIPLTPSSSGNRRTLSIKIQQFPFVCAVGATVYKVQGETLRSMSVVDWKADPAIGNRPQQAYLMVSRVVKRDGLVSLKPMTAEIAAWAKPPPAAIEEDRRIQGVSAQTILHFYGPDVTDDV